jgi:NAD(P)-dependent dehydrogenase (short-subunit alcohol dehydrogenase family)
MPRKLEGRVALVTGASKGIGAGIAKAMPGAKQVGSKARWSRCLVVSARDDGETPEV